jgi:hypothetical protein
MKRRVFFPLLLLMLATTAAESFAGNWYVRKGATGSNNGTDWNNAWNEMNQINFSAVACGDTIWIAGGTYTSALSPTKSCTATTVLNIFRVLSTDSVPIGAAGWNSAFDSTVILSNAGINVGNGSAYWTVDGRVGTVASNNFGISAQFTGGNYGIEFAAGASANHLTFSHIEIYGPSCVTAQSCSSDTHAFDIRWSAGTVSNITVDHSWLHREAEIIWIGPSVSNLTFQYTQIDTSATTADEHADILYGSAGITISNLTFRYCRIFNSDNDGMLFESSTTINGFYFYGNMYYHSMNEIFVFKSGQSISNLYFYNNVFEWDPNATFPSGNTWQSFFNWGATPTSGAVENNVFEDLPAGPWGGVTADYNAYSSDIGKQDSGTHSFTYVKGTQFVNEPDESNPSAADFHLISSGVTSFGGKGTTLSAPYNTDIDGNVCSTSCSVGAYQSTSNANTPAAPSGLTAAVQ